MASLLTAQGLNTIADLASGVAGAAGAIRAMSVDDATEAFQAADTKLDDGTGYTQEFDANLDSTPTRSGQTVSHVMTIPAGSGNFTIKRIALHNNVAGSVSGTTTTLVGGVDQLSL